MHTPRRVAALGMASAAMVTAAIATAPSAAADSYNGCIYPRVCFYPTVTQWNNGAPTAGYQDVTSSYQNLGPNSRGADYVRNTRNDDRVYLRYTYNPTGATGALCVNPNVTALFNSNFTVTGIMIQTASSCP
ncbi:hypothetical protein PV726_39390 [Streptomyces europaeiscabiei]|uniref:hypothetical protein n=1 Tax=Streptomyces europaeiscabiei TaxID=146819 RepID=UPI0029AD58F5|nr:hypothetical protein [Streptomyces europaeiscabiei]MDX3696272.1 hypothetical protein [Streptomyces europaeiscabiei]